MYFDREEKKSNYFHKVRAERIMQIAQAIKQSSLPDLVGKIKKSQELCFDHKGGITYKFVYNPNTESKYSYLLLISRDQRTIELYNKVKEKGINLSNYFGSAGTELTDPNIEKDIKKIEEKLGKNRDNSNNKPNPNELAIELAFAINEESYEYVCNREIMNFIPLILLADIKTFIQNKYQKFEYEPPELKFDDNLLINEVHYLAEGKGHYADFYEEYKNQHRDDDGWSYYYTFTHEIANYITVLNREISKELCEEMTFIEIRINGVKGDDNFAGWVELRMRLPKEKNDRKHPIEKDKRLKKYIEDVFKKITLKILHKTSDNMSYVRNMYLRFLGDGEFPCLSISPDLFDIISETMESFPMSIYEDEQYLQYNDDEIKEDNNKDDKKDDNTNKNEKNTKKNQNKNTVKKTERPAMVENLLARILEKKLYEQIILSNQKLSTISGTPIELTSDKKNKKKYNENRVLLIQRIQTLCRSLKPEQEFEESPVAVFKFNHLNYTLYKRREKYYVQSAKSISRNYKDGVIMSLQRDSAYCDLYDIGHRKTLGPTAIIPNGVLKDVLHWLALRHLQKLLQIKCPPILFSKEKKDSLPKKIESLFNGVKTFSMATEDKNKEFYVLRKKGHYYVLQASFSPKNKISGIYWPDSGGNPVEQNTSYGRKVPIEILTELEQSLSQIDDYVDEGNDIKVDKL